MVPFRRTDTSPQLPLHRISKHDDGGVVAEDFGAFLHQRLNEALRNLRVVAGETASQVGGVGAASLDGGVINTSTMLVRTMLRQRLLDICLVCRQFRLAFGWKCACGKPTQFAYSPSLLILSRLDYIIGRFWSKEVFA